MAFMSALHSHKAPSLFPGLVGEGIPGPGGYFQSWEGVPGHGGTAGPGGEGGVPGPGGVPGLDGVFLGLTGVFLGLGGISGPVRGFLGLGVGLPGLVDSTSRPGNSSSLWCFKLLTCF